jgi:hypothetical protein
MDPDRIDVAASAPAGPAGEPSAVSASTTPEDGSATTEAIKGPTGSRGPTGPSGPRGPIATSFAAGAVLLAASPFATVTVDAECPPGSEVIAGGFDTSVTGTLSGEVKVNSAVAIDGSAITPARYRVGFTRTGTASGSPIVVSAFAVCSP